MVGGGEGRGEGKGEESQGDHVEGEDGGSHVVS